MDTMAKVEPEAQLVAVGPATGSGGADGIARVAVAARNALHEEHNDDEGKGAPGDKKTEEPGARMASFFQLFMFADRFDYLLMIVGTLGAVGNGEAANCSLRTWRRKGAWEPQRDAMDMDPPKARPNQLNQRTQAWLSLHSPLSLLTSQ